MKMLRVSGVIFAVKDAAMGVVSVDGLFPQNKLN